MGDEVEQQQKQSSTLEIVIMVCFILSMSVLQRNRQSATGLDPVGECHHDMTQI